MACPHISINKAQLTHPFGDSVVVRVPHRSSRGSVQIARAGVKEIARRLALKQEFLGSNEAYTLTKLTLDTVVEIVAEGEKVTLPGFGTFAPITQKARRSRNPRTGETFVTDAKVVPRFTASKTFKEHVAIRLAPETAELD
ncbi:hypothetical protein BSKO_06048 [Bryopsis sp. KO-2023]|nr:hypothetical protein BSKO_06048 [Bryopsis sp. KO-2023]